MACWHHPAGPSMDGAMTLSILQVDAFTDRPFAGNPAAVCVLPQARDEGWMQAVAREMNLSETAFLVPLGDAEAQYDLRWFTPVAEVELCGHATLASAHALWDSGALAPDRDARFTTKSGPLSASRDGDWIAMDFPATPATPLDAHPAGLADALGAEPHTVGHTRFDYLVELPTAAAVRELQPDFGAVLRLGVRGVIVTALADDGEHDFVSRFFAPFVGIDEDPVTGSAHCALGPYWCERLGVDEVRGFQASARGGTVRVRNRGERVELRGQAVTVLRAELLD